MPLVFQNNSGEDAYLACLWYDSSCGPTDNWRKMGWYKITNGSSFQFTAADLSQTVGLMAWFADWWAGGPSWSGSGQQWYWVTNNAFDQCYDDNTNCNVQYDFQNLEFNGNYGLTVTLHPPSSEPPYTVTPINKPQPPPHSDHSDIWGSDCGDCDCDCECDCDCDC
jgi:hypothetical protein